MLQGLSLSAHSPERKRKGVDVCGRGGGEAWKGLGGLRSEYIAQKNLFLINKKEKEKKAKGCTA